MRYKKRDTYPVLHVNPAFQGNALENRQKRHQRVVERRDATVRIDVAVHAHGGHTSHHRAGATAIRAINITHALIVLVQHRRGAVHRRKEAALVELPAEQLHADDAEQEEAEGT